MGHCGSFREMWVSVGQEAIVVRKEGSVGLLVNCGSVWVSVGQEVTCKKRRKCGSFSELWVIVGYCGSLWVVWVF